MGRENGGSTELGVVWDGDQGKKQRCKQERSYACVGDNDRHDRLTQRSTWLGKTWSGRALENYCLAFRARIRPLWHDPSRRHLHPRVSEGRTTPTMLRDWLYNRIR